MNFQEFVVSAVLTVLYITSGITAASFIMYSKNIIENMAAATVSIELNVQHSKLFTG